MDYFYADAAISRLLKQETNVYNPLYLAPGGDATVGPWASGGDASLRNEYGQGFTAEAGGTASVSAPAFDVYTGNIDMTSAAFDVRGYGGYSFLSQSAGNGYVLGNTSAGAVRIRSGSDIYVERGSAMFGINSNSDIYGNATSVDFRAAAGTARMQTSSHGQLYLGLYNTYNAATLQAPGAGSVLALHGTSSTPDQWNNTYNAIYIKGVKASGTNSEFGSITLGDASVGGVLIEAGASYASYANSANIALEAYNQTVGLQMYTSGTIKIGYSAVYSYIGFFGQTPAAQPTLPNASPSNYEISQALHDLGLVNWAYAS